MTKRDRISGIPLARAIYGLYQNGRLVMPGSSGLEGDLTFIGLEPGQYELREITAPPGYQTETNAYRIVVDQEGRVTIDGQPATGFSLYDVPLSTLLFSKTDADTGLPLPGAIFTLSNGRVAASGADGLVRFGQLAAGTYTMTETAVPPGYAPNTHIYTVEVAATGGITIDGVELSDFVIQNAPLTPFAFTKFDTDTQRPLPGAVFTLSGGQTAVSGSDGRVDFGALPAGGYTLTETAQPSGYLPNPRTYTVVVGSDGHITVDGVDAALFSVGNTPAAALSFIKTDAVSGLPLPGAVFSLSNGQTAVSSADGRIHFRHLEPGTYTMTEIASPIGYLPNPHVYTVVVAAGQVTIDGVDVSAFAAVNTAYPRLVFRKYDAGTPGFPLPGSTFTLSNGATAISDANGQVDLGPLPPGTYTMTETAVPAGYLPNPHVYTVSVYENGSILIDGAAASTFAAYNTPLTSLQFTKYDAETLRTLPGAVFRLSTGAVATSDANGRVNFGPLSPGTYYMDEIAAPAGYYPVSQMFTIVVERDGSITIDGTAMENFFLMNTAIVQKSEPPTIDRILERNPILTGTGIPGATVQAILPDGRAHLTTVTANGTWLIIVQQTLLAGDVVTAYQQVPGYTLSDPVSTVVIPASRS